jgi:predicted ester cyclase
VRPRSTQETTNRHRGDPRSSAATNVGRADIVAAQNGNTDREVLAMSVSTPSAMAIADRLRAAFISGDPEVLGGCYAADGILVHPVLGRVAGRESIVAAEASLFASFDQVGFDIERVITDSTGWAAICAVISGRHCRELALPDGQTIPSRGNRIAVPTVEIVQMGPDDLISESHRYHDSAAMLGALAAGVDLPLALRPTPGPEPGDPAPDAAVLAQRVKAAYEAADMAAVVACYEPTGVLVHPIAGVLAGHDAIAAAEGPLATAFSDLEFTIHRVLQQQWWAAVECTVSATHSADLVTPMGTIPATGRRISDNIVQVLQLAPDGRMAYAERTFDTAALLSQLTG